jgi:hypothetical protein
MIELLKNFKFTKKLKNQRKTLFKPLVTLIDLIRLIELTMLIDKP